MKSIAVIFCCVLVIGIAIMAALINRNLSNSSNEVEHTQPPISSDEDLSTVPPILEEEEKVETTQKTYTLMDLGSRGCYACDNLQPILEALRLKYDGAIDILFYDVNRTSEGATLATKYKVQYIPTLIFLSEEGEEMRRYVGFLSQRQIESIFISLGWIE